jgi:hypothetical protein
MSKEKEGNEPKKGIWRSIGDAIMSPVGKAIGAGILAGLLKWHNGTDNKDKKNE